MKSFGKIQEIIKNFIYEKQQRNQQIKEIEKLRIQLAQKRNEKKLIYKNMNAYATNAEAEIYELGKQISELGNQSQDLQNKLDARFIEVKEQVYNEIDTLISEAINEFHEEEKEKQHLEEKIMLQEQRKAKYEIQRQEFFARFGRMPELSKEAQEENLVKEQECIINRKKISEIEIKINNIQTEISELLKNKKQFKNGNWNSIVQIEEKQEISFEKKLDLLANELIEEQNQIIKKCEEIEETIILPSIEQEENVLKDINIDELQPIGEVNIEEKTSIKEIKIENIDIIDEIQIEEAPFFSEIELQECQLEEVEPIVEIEIEEIDSDKQNIVEQKQEKNIQELIEEIEEEIITLEEQEKEVDNNVKIFNDKIKLTNIIAKIESGAVVYKAQISNGETIKIYPTRIEDGNILAKEKEKRQELKEILLNYAISEYRTLDKKVIKNVDIVICELLNRFAKQYNYNAQDLIYNYAMSFSKNIEMDTDEIPQITYNFAFIDEAEINKKEKDKLMKVCKNARKNEKIEIIGYNSGLTKIKCIFRRIFASSANALPEARF